MKYETYERIIGMIQSISSEESCCNQMVSVMTAYWKKMAPYS